MKRRVRIMFIILIALASYGCGNQSSLVGRIVDGKGQPIAGVAVKATPVQPIKEYQEFVVATGADGTFTFTKLHPDSDYIIFPWSESWIDAPVMTVCCNPTNIKVYITSSGWIGEKKISLRSSPKGQTLTLPSDLVVIPSVSTVQGKIIDGKGQPVNSLRVVAEQTNAIKGYERFESVTGADGTFCFERLFPNCEYSIYPFSDEWLKDFKIQIETGSEGQVISLQEPQQVRFRVGEESIINDTQTGLMWAKVLERKMYLAEAFRYVMDVTHGDHQDWMLPTTEELQTLLGLPGNLGMQSALGLTNKCIAALEKIKEGKWPKGSKDLNERYEYPVAILRFDSNGHEEYVPLNRIEVRERKLINRTGGKEKADEALTMVVISLQFTEDNSLKEGSCENLLVLAVRSQ